MALSPGQRLGPYAIVSPLGAGGMGEVYRATDSKLGRDVALKVLPPEMARDPDRLLRFQREARAVAALNHPHIVTIYSVEEIDGIHFLSMELVEGEVLSTLIARHGRPAPAMSIESVIHIATQIADALAAAHEKGIVHRDLKPANVMVTSDGRLKVLDFGLARTLDPGPRTSDSDPSADATLTAAGHTEVGVVMGTPAYMSPEQVTGRTIDHRSDIFSLGIVLYEAASGTRPFDGPTSVELASAILRDEPRPLAEMRADVPAGLTRLLRRCLEKNPQDRVQTARGVINELREMTRSVTRDAPAVSTSDEGFGITVLPFKYSGGNAELGALAEGVTEEIVTGLSRFSYLRVVAHGQTTAISVRYRIEGSLRQAGSMLRVGAQLVDTRSGAHLWAETYDRPFRAEDIFALQDDLAPRIVSTVADWNGVLCRSMTEALRGRRPDQLTPYEALLRSFGFNDRATPEEHAAVREILEHAVRMSPGASDCWALLSLIYTGEFGHGFNPRPDPLGRAMEAARRAVDGAPGSQIAHYALAGALFFRKEVAAFRHAAQRAVALNPMNSATTAHLGMLMAYAGDWQQGCALIAHAAQLNPQHPGWYWFVAFYNAYRQRDYQAALDAAAKLDMPHFVGTHAVLAMAHAGLGDRDAARKAIRDLLALRPDYALRARDELGKWFQPELLEHLLDGLRKAGLEIADHAASAEKPWQPSIAVLPFANMSGDAEQDYFSDGLAEEIINALVKVPGLKVTARTSAFAFKGQNTDIRKIAQALDVANILEGSVRRSGHRIRVTAQLLSATDGSHLWSERYDREVADVFAVQDEIAAAIARALDVALAPDHGARRHTPVLEAYEANLKGHHFQFKLTPESAALASEAYQRAIALDPQFALARVGLADYYLAGAAIGLMPAREAMPLVREHARRALEIDPSLAEAHAMLGIVAGVYDYDWREAAERFERAIALAPASNWVRVWHSAFFLMWVGSPDQAIAQVREALQADPLNAIYRWNLAGNLHAAGQEAEASAEFLHILEIDENFWYACVNLGLLHASQGRLADALAYARRARAIVPFAPQVAGLLAGLLMRAGETAEAASIVQSLRPDVYMVPTGLTIFHFLCGDIDEAAKWIGHAIDQRDPMLVSITCRALGPDLLSSPQWAPLAARMNLP